MKEKSEELNVLKQLFNNLSDEDKKTFLDSLIQDKQKVSLNVQDIIKPRTPITCPHCSSSYFVKNGTKGGTQRYLCRGCRKTFVADTGTILFQTKKPLSVWKKYIKCMMNRFPLRKCAKECGIDLTTAFNWRHKILDALQKMMSEVKLDGIVEADETYTPISYKGNHRKSRNFKMPRPAHHRGTRAGKRGLSKEQVCVPCCVNLNGKSIAKVSNLGKPRLVDIQNVLNGNIRKDSVFVTDSMRSYQKISVDMELNHIRIPRNNRTVGTFNIQTVNSYHSHLKNLIFGRFKSVATKYLNNYLVYHNFVNFAKETEDEKEVILFDFIRETKCGTRCHTISDRPALPVLRKG